jgi:hypothetical protein
MEAPRLNASLATNPDTADFRTRHKSPIAFSRLLALMPRRAVTADIRGRFLAAPKRVEGSPPKHFLPLAGRRGSTGPRRRVRSLTWLNHALLRRPIVSQRENPPASARRGIGVLRRLPALGNAPRDLRPAIPQGVAVGIGLSFIRLCEYPEHRNASRRHPLGLPHGS